MNIEIWSVGKENDPHIEVGILNYFKKIKPYASIQLEIIQIPKSKLSQDAEKNKNLEAEYILKKLQTHHYLILLDETGKKLNSPQWAQQLQQLMNQRVKTLVLLIGGAYGVTDEIKKTSKQMWSLSDLVFPHQLVRLLLAEQIYRSYSILNNLPYHHE
ncbi:MAG: hypothetical protein RL624_772 [Bacteroidota bacterium]|jgi:23S rRNA (pseudouridine1915-N3)-methyltransferase